MVGVPLVVTSGVRCARYNSAVTQGNSGGEHVDGEAADILCVTGNLRFNLLECIYTGGLFCRIGVGKNFLHVGVSKTLPQDVNWTY